MSDDNPAPPDAGAAPAAPAAETDPPPPLEPVTPASPVDPPISDTDPINGEPHPTGDAAEPAGIPATAIQPHVPRFRDIYSHGAAAVIDALDRRNEMRTRLEQARMNKVAASAEADRLAAQSTSLTSAADDAIVAAEAALDTAENEAREAVTAQGALLASYLEQNPEA